MIYLDVVSISDSWVCFLECDNKMAAVLMQGQILKATKENTALSLFPWATLWLYLSRTL